MDDDVFVIVDIFAIYHDLFMTGVSVHLKRPDQG